MWIRGLTLTRSDDTVEQNTHIDLYPIFYLVHLDRLVHLVVQIVGANSVDPISLQPTIKR